MKFSSVLVFLVLGGILQGCRDRDVAELARSLRGQEYVQTVTAGRHEVSLRYLPRKLIALTALAPDSTAILDEAMLARIRSVAPPDTVFNFLLKLAPADTSAVGISGDVVFGNLSGYKDYRETGQAYQFEMEHRIWLESSGHRFPVARCHMENSWGLTKDRSFFLVFALPKRDLPTLKRGFEIVLDDIIPGLSRKKFAWKPYLETFDETI